MACRSILTEAQFQKEEGIPADYSRRALRSNSSAETACGISTSIADAPSRKSPAIATKAYKGATDSWITPPEIVAALGEFDLDPCMSTPQPWRHATNGFTEADDGLSQYWTGRVWMNPPYGPATRQWMARLADHGNGIALIQARIETAWFFSTVWERADAILVLRGRLRFYTPDGIIGHSNSGGPCVLVAYGSNNVEALRHSGIEGRLIEVHTRVSDRSEEPTARSARTRNVERGGEERAETPQ